MAIEFLDPDLMDVLSSDLLDFDENPDDEDYEENRRRLQEETAEFLLKYPQFKVSCEWCCEGFVFHNELQPSYQVA